MIIYEWGWWYVCVCVSATRRAQSTMCTPLSCAHICSHVCGYVHMYMNGKHMQTSYRWCSAHGNWKNININTATLQRVALLLSLYVCVCVCQIIISTNRLCILYVFFMLHCWHTRALCVYSRLRIQNTYSHVQHTAFRIKKIYQWRQHDIPRAHASMRSTNAFRRHLVFASVSVFECE